ncbi:hypothetical protein R3P38DRAFT_3558236 [Favolaschia claudopus]|uniref:F-box domain-containing protein n=1 Tax=Favolaschia claudopus TaxID=2862362 RepID=A0AAW0AY10_9AGAR
MLCSSRRNPLDVEKLLHLSLDFLELSPSDLCSCALVAHSWVQPAQSRLFRSPRTTNPYFLLASSNVISLHETLLCEPRLIPLVRELDIRYPYIAQHALDSICRLGFTHVTTLALKIRDDLSSSAAETLRTLSTLPTLRSLSLETIESEKLAFPLCMPLFDRCSSTIEHLTLRCYRFAEDGLSNASYDTARIQLRSLRLEIQRRPKLAHCSSLNPLTLAPFDLSYLKALSVEENSSAPWDCVSWPSIELLDFMPNFKRDTALLKRFSSLHLSNLSFLRLQIRDSILPTLHILKTIARSLENGNAPNLRNIVIVLVDFTTLKSKTPAWVEFDSVLCAFPVGCPEIELEYRYHAHGLKRALTKALLPNSISCGKVKVVRGSWQRSKDDIWWRGMVQKL